MVPLLITLPISDTATKIRENIILTSVGLTLKDELYNPFEDVTEDYVYGDTVEITAASIEQSEKPRPIPLTKREAAEARKKALAGPSPQPLSLQVELRLSNDMKVMERKRYNVWDALGDIGGFHDGLILFVQVIFMGRYSSAMFEHSIVQGAKYRKGPGGA